MRRIAVVTGARADYGIYRPILRRMMAESDIELLLLVCGAHLSAEYGRTIDTITADGFRVAARIETLEAGDGPLDVARSMGNGLRGFGQAYAELRPDLVLVLGDRYEMFAATSAALPFSIPLAHIHGGESTEGAFDEAIRHSITKMSHIHFATTDLYARRIVQMGERRDHVFVTGAPSLDNLSDIPVIDRAALERHLGRDLTRPPLLVTFHPVTLEYRQTETQIGELLAVLASLDDPMIFTYPNADTYGRIVVNAIERFVSEHANAIAVKSLGTDLYFSLMKIAGAMIGNSSSGIIEAASFGLPVVNIGNRQRGRVHGENVIDCAADRREIMAAVGRALDPAFHRSLAAMRNPYGDGHAAQRIVEALKTVELGPKLIQKTFYDWPQMANARA